jgi:hypothetical protein
MLPHLDSAAVSTLATSVPFKDTDTRIGRIELANGYPTQSNVDLLFGEMDFQRATQAYLWSLPVMGFAQWHNQHEQVLGAKDTDLVLYDSFQDKLGLPAANATTPCILAACPRTSPTPTSASARPSPRRWA